MIFFISELFCTLNSAKSALQVTCVAGFLFLRVIFGPLGIPDVNGSPVACAPYDEMEIFDSRIKVNSQVRYSGWTCSSSKFRVLHTTIHIPESKNGALLWRRDEKLPFRAYCNARQLRLAALYLHLPVRFEKIQNHTFTFLLSWENQISPMVLARSA